MQAVRPAWNARLIAGGLIALLAVSALAVRLVQLQVGEHQRLAAAGVETRVHRVVLEADRGVVYDRHGVQLAGNSPAWQLSMLPAALPADAVLRQAELAQVARLSGVPEPSLGHLLLSAPDLYAPVTVKSGLSADQSQALAERLPQLPGIQLDPLPLRTYADWQDFGHVLGYTNRLNANEYARLKSLGYLPDETAGKAGVEAGLEALLRGRNGWADVETNAAGLPVRTVAEDPPLAGDSVYLSIDAGLQQAVGQYLRDGIQAAGVKAGAALVVDPRDGQVLAMVSAPGYDPNQFTAGISAAAYQRLLQDPAKPLYDRALAGLYPPGSTFKMITAAAGLEDGKLAADTVLPCPASISYGGWTYRNWAGYDMGPMNVEKAIAVSCDTFFYRVADSVGDMSLANYARDFGYGTAPRFEIPGAQAGLVPDEAWQAAQCAQSGAPGCRWNPGETLTMGIGQSALLTSPLIQAMYVSAVANGGTLLQPTVVSQVRAPGGEVVSTAHPTVISQVPVSPANLEVVRQGMRQCLQAPYGTGFLFRNDRFKYDGGCKTGSAQYGGSGTNLPLHAWFTFFSPYDHPEIAIVVVVEGGGEGHDTAEPVAVKVADYYYSHRDQIRAA
ncbi:MAG TPA: penicillin-binding protein 2 [Candidatus Dormibacteraeota bacterium]